MSDGLGLFRCLNVPGGMTVKDAENFAGLRLELLREKSLAEIDDAIDSIGGYLHLLKGEPPRAVESEIQRLASSVLNIAGTFGLEGLGKAAYSLCAMIDELSMRGEWDRERVDVHFDAMRLLRHPDAVSQSMQKRLLDGLEKVIHHAEPVACK